MTLALLIDRIPAQRFIILEIVIAWISTLRIMFDFINHFFVNFQKIEIWLDFII